MSENQQKRLYPKHDITAEKKNCHHQVCQHVSVQQIQKLFHTSGLKLTSANFTLAILQCVHFHSRRGLSAEHKGGGKQVALKAAAVFVAQKWPHQTVIYPLSPLTHIPQNGRKHLTVTVPAAPRLVSVH